MFVFAVSVEVHPNAATTAATAATTAAAAATTTGKITEHLQRCQYVMMPSIQPPLGNYEGGWRVASQHNTQYLGNHN